MLLPQVELSDGHEIPGSGSVRMRSGRRRVLPAARWPLAGARGLFIMGSPAGWPQLEAVRVEGVCDLAYTAFFAGSHSQCCALPGSPRAQHFPCSGEKKWDHGTAATPRNQLGGKQLAEPEALTHPATGAREWS